MTLKSITNQSLSLSLSVRVEDLQMLEQLMKVLQARGKLAPTRTLRLAIRDWMVAEARAQVGMLIQQGLMQQLPVGETMTPSGERVYAIPMSSTAPYGTVVASLATPQGLPLIRRLQTLDPTNPNARPAELSAFPPNHSAVVRSVTTWFALGYYTSPARYAGLPQPRDMADHCQQAAQCGATYEYMQAALRFHHNPGQYADILLDPTPPGYQPSHNPATAPAAPTYRPVPPTPQDDFPAHWNEPPSAEEEARAHRVLDEISRNDALTARKARIDAEDAAERQRQRDATPEEDPFDTDAQWRAAGLNPDPLAPT